MSFARQEIASIQSRLDDGSASREQLTSALHAASIKVAGLPANDATRRLQDSLDALRLKVAAAPVATPGESIDAPVPPGPALASSPDQAASLGDEVSFKTLKIRPPIGAVLDLAAADSPSPSLGYSFSGGKVLFTSTPQSDAKQKQPWVRTRSFMAEVLGTYSINATSGNAVVSYGTLNGMPVTDVTVRPTSDASSRREILAIFEDGVWVTATAEGIDAASFAVAEASALTMRPAAGEPGVDPLAPDRVAARLTDDPEDAAEILAREGPAAETAIIAHVHDPGVNARRAAVRLLGGIDNDRARQELIELAKSNDGFVVDEAKSALRKLSPQSDDVADALLDVESDDATRQKQGLHRLADATADASRRPKVAAALEKFTIDGPPGGDYEAVGDALAVWATPDTVPTLVPLVAGAETDVARRDDAMDVLAKLHDKRPIKNICRWLISGDAHAKSALIAFGPIAEADVIKLLSNTDPSVRRQASDILEQIGGKRSVAALARFEEDRRDLAVSAAAKSATLAIQERLASGANGAAPGDVAPPKPPATPLTNPLPKKTDVFDDMPN